MCSFTKVSPSLQSLSRSCRLHVARLKRYFTEVWDQPREGRVQSEGTFSVPLGPFQSGWPTFATPVTWLALYTCTFCVCPRRWYPVLTWLRQCAGLCGFFCSGPIEGPVEGHLWMCCSFVALSGDPRVRWTVGHFSSIVRPVGPRPFVGHPTNLRDFQAVTSELMIRLHVSVTHVECIITFLYQNYVHNKNSFDVHSFNVISRVHVRG